MSLQKHTKLVRERDYVAEVPVELIEAGDPWAPYLSQEEARRLDRVRLALRRGDVATAAKHGRVYRLELVQAC